MKIEPRGKYAGVKVHLDEAESREFLRIYEEAEAALNGAKKSAISLSITASLPYKLGKQIRKLIAKEPSVLQDKSEDQIKAVLQKEHASAAAKLAAIAKGQDWKEVSVG